MAVARHKPDGKLDEIHSQTRLKVSQSWNATDDPSLLTLCHPTPHLSKQSS